MKETNVKNEIDQKLAALVARKKSQSINNDTVDLTKLWPSTLSTNTRGGFTGTSGNYASIVKVDRTYNG